MMKTFALIFVVSSSSAILSSSALAQVRRVPPEQLGPPNRQELMAERLETAPMDQRPFFLRAFKAIPLAQRKPVVFDALLKEAERMRKEEMDAEIATRGTLPDHDHHADENVSNYKWELHKLLAEYQDPRIIPAMLDYASQAVMAEETIADFGEDAVPHLITVATSEDDEAHVAIDVLRQMLTRKTVRKPLTPASRKRLVGIAGDRLRGNAQNIAVAYASIKLAKATRDPELLKQLKRLAAATDRRGAEEIGVRNPEEQEMLREALREEVADIPFTP